MKFFYILFSSIIVIDSVLTFKSEYKLRECKKNYDLQIQNLNYKHNNELNIMKYKNKVLFKELNEEEINSLKEENEVLRLENSKALEEKLTNLRLRDIISEQDERIRQMLNKYEYGHTK